MSVVECVCTLHASTARPCEGRESGGDADFRDMATTSQRTRSSGLTAGAQGAAWLAAGREDRGGGHGGVLAGFGDPTASCLSYRRLYGFRGRGLTSTLDKPAHRHTQNTRELLDGLQLEVGDDPRLDQRGVPLGRLRKPIELTSSKTDKRPRLLQADANGAGDTLLHA